MDQRTLLQAVRMSWQSQQRQHTRCLRHFKEVVLTDEWYTSQTCRACYENGILSKVKEYWPKGGGFPIRGLRQCTNTKCRKYQNRDLTAAYLIRVNLMDEENLCKRWKLNRIYRDSVCKVRSNRKFCFVHLSLNSKSILFICLKFIIYSNLYCWEWSSLAIIMCVIQF